MEQGEGAEAVNVPIGPAAFVFRHKKTKQIVVAPNESWEAYQRDKKNWELTASLNACAAIEYMINATPAERNDYIKRLIKKP